MNRLACVVGTGLMGLAVIGSANAGTVTTYSFTNISGNKVADANAGESQLRMDVSEVAGKAQFRFYHAGSIPMVIARAYFDDRTPRLGAAETPTGTGVAFSPGGAPPELPAGATLDPVFNSTVRFTANAPAPSNGVGPSDQLFLKFAIATGSFADLIGDLNNGTMRVGLHVISFVGGGSEAFVLEPPVPNDPSGPEDPITIPLPGTAGMGLAGLIVLGGCRRRR